MNTNKRHYAQMAQKVAPKPKTWLNCLKAFLVGGTICTIGEVIHTFLENWGVNPENIGAYVAITLIFLAVLLTGLGIFDNIVDFAGAGASVPITGFANAMAAPAIEFKKEGFILGVGAKMFLIAGPVIVYGTLASMAVGTIYYIIQKLGG
ncbi:MAG: stage V sporulation protein AC [Defluviitaleaceae bacterium]|nr:stage V sporulation protein AC [Defluviitaleaceae bacterium]